MKALLLILVIWLPAFTQTTPEAVSSPTLGIDIASKVKTVKGKDKLIYKYDRFKDYTTVAIKPFDLLTTGERMAVAFVRSLESGRVGRGQTDITYPASFHLAAVFGFKGLTLKEEPRLAMVFLSSGGGWRFLKDHTLYAIIDGERLELGEGKHDGDVRFGGVSEQMIFEVSKDHILKIANGKTVEIQLGGFERKLKSGNMERIRILLSLIDIK